METEGFLPVPLAELIFIADEGTEVLPYLAGCGMARTHHQRIPDPCFLEGPTSAR
jgi:hypothetical protein